MEKRTHSNRGLLDRPGMGENPKSFRLHKENSVIDTKSQDMFVDMLSSIEKNVLTYESEEKVPTTEPKLTIDLNKSFHGESFGEESNLKVMNSPEYLKVNLEDPEVFDCNNDYDDIVKSEVFTNEALNNEYTSKLPESSSQNQNSQGRKAYGDNNTNNAASGGATSKRSRPMMAVRLALTDTGPFHKLIREGIPVIIHFLPAQETRVRRVKRLMILDAVSNFDEYGEELPFHKRVMPKLKFAKLDVPQLLATLDYVHVNDVLDIVTGAFTTVLHRSMTQLYGKANFDRSNNEKRCFTIMGPISPFDGRPCIDVEINPYDRQKSEVRSNGAEGVPHKLCMPHKL